MRGRITGVVGRQITDCQCLLLFYDKDGVETGSLKVCLGGSEEETEKETEEETEEAEEEEAGKEEEEEEERRREGEEQG